MPEDQVETTPPSKKKPSASEKLFKARERLRVEVEQREETAPRTAKRETREPMVVDWEKVDRTDELLLAEAEELRLKLTQNPDRKDAEEIQQRIDVLSEGVGRERNTPGDMEARLYGLGFLLERNSEKLPGSIREITGRMENPRDYADYMDARRGLEPALTSLARDVGNAKADEVRNMLQRRGELRRLTDHFDYTVSGQMSLQEKFSLYLQEGGVFQAIVSKFEERYEKKKKKGLRARAAKGVLQGLKGMYSEPERTFLLRRAVANNFEAAWKWLGFREMRPTTMFSQARLRMERGEADPIEMMAMKVGEEREAIQKDVEARLQEEGVTVEGVQAEETAGAAVPAAEEAPEPPTEEVSKKVSKPEPLTQREKLQARIDNLKKQEDEAAVAGDAWDLYERTVKEREGLEAQLQSLDEAEETAAAKEEKGLPASEQKSLTEAEELSREKLVSQLHALADALKEGKLNSDQEQLIRRLIGPEVGKADQPGAEKTAIPQAEVAKTGEGKLSYEERVLRDRTAELLGKDPKELLADLSQLASGELSLEEFAGEVYAEDWKKSKKLQRRFIGRFQDHLKRYGYSKDELEKAGSKELQSMFNRTIEDVLKDEKNSVARKARSSYFWLNFFQYLYEDLKGIVVKQAQEAFAQ